MKNRQKLITIAKSMFKKSLTDGNVDPQKVQSVLKEAPSQHKVRLVAILKFYKRQVEQALAKEHLTVEIGTKFKVDKKLEEAILVKTGAQRIYYKVNPNLVFGTRITHGDWIYDATLPAKLSQLKK